MSITKRVLLYSVTTLSIIVISIISYFVLMFSPLYADYVATRRLETVRQTQNQFLAGNFDTSTFSTEIKNFDAALMTGTVAFFKGKYEVAILTNYGSLIAEITDDELQAIYDELILLTDVSDISSDSDHEEKFQAIGEEIAEFFDKKYPKQEANQFDWLNIVQNTFAENDFEELFSLSNSDFQFYNETQIIYVSEVFDESNYYTSYLGFLNTDTAIFITVANAITPQLNELQPIIMNSLPTIILTCIFFILVASLLFAKYLIRPLQRLVDITYNMKNDKFIPTQFTSKAHNEFAELEEMMQQLYLNLQSKNQLLEEQQKQQHIFVMASSHQLKTPIAATLLLLEGMIANVGKYRVRDTYLPKARLELLEMQKIIDEMLELNTSTIELANLQNVDVVETINNCLIFHQILIDKKELIIQTNFKQVSHVNTHPLFFYKIIDNIIKNAIIYTPDNKRVEISYWDNTIAIKNFGITISEPILPQIFEPFIRATNEKSGHGLGLYIVAHYAKLLNIKVKISNDNQANAVVTIITILPKE
jgi:Signal transduction histidine kinase